MTDGRKITVVDRYGFLQLKFGKEHAASASMTDGVFSYLFDHEHIYWIRDWHTADSEEGKALLAAHALVQP